MRVRITLGLCFIMLLSACTATSLTWQEQYDMGIRYLSEGNYEEAIIAFTAAIEIDPKQADAYVGLADAYVAQGDLEKARQILEDALPVVSDPNAIRTRLDRLEQGAALETSDGLTAESTPSSTVIASGDCAENLKWSLDNNGTLIISGVGPMGDRLWEDFENDTLWYEYYDSIMNVIIEDGVTSIGEMAFGNFPNLAGVTIPNSITSISDGAFYNCRSLTNVIIPDSVISLGVAFQSCTGLVSVTIGNGVTNIGNSAFYDCSSLTSVTIGNGVTSIDNGAFHSCTSLTSIDIPDSVTSMGQAIFYNCSSLRNVTISGSITSIEGNTFYGCNNLRSVTIPSNVTSIDFEAFYGCNSLTDVYFGGSENQWNHIYIYNDDNGNDPLYKANIHFNS